MKKALFYALILFSFVASAKTEKIRVACIGDSITFGSKIKGRDVNSYPALLQNLLGSKYEVRNFGNPGRGIIKTSKKGKTPRAYIFMKEHKAALEFNPNIVICNLGINDLMDYPKKSTDFIPDYKELISLYRNLPTKPQVIVWSPLSPLMKGQKFYGKPTVGKINDAIAKAVKEMNKKSKKLPKVLTLDMQKKLNKPELFTKDNIHPNNKGAKAISEITAKKVKSLK